MNGYIETRVVLVLIILLNLTIAYRSNAVHRHISKRLWNGLFIVQAVAVTLYILLNDILTPIQNADYMTIFGYIFVYFFMFLGWASWLPNTFLEPDTVYLMEPCDMLIYKNEHYVSGVVKTGLKETHVLLKNEPSRPLPQQPIAVKLLCICDGYIFVTAIRTLSVYLI